MRVLFDFDFGDGLRGGARSSTAGRRLSSSIAARALPFRVAARLADVARAHGLEDLQQWFSNYLTTALQTRVGANRPLDFELGVFQSNQEIRTLVLAFQQMWDVYREFMPASSPEAESMRARLNQSWLELRHRIAPERIVVCVHCQQADQTQIYVAEGRVRYLCKRCNQVGLII